MVPGAGLMPYRRNQSPLTTYTYNHISVFQPNQEDHCGLHLWFTGYYLIASHDHLIP